MIDTSTHLPRTDGSVTLAGLDARVVIHRDGYGIPSITAGTEHDAWVGMGYASAQDRLWQMDWYRRRGMGRWAEVAGPAGLIEDRLFRRFGLAAASQADVEAMGSETRAMFDAYATGVNAYIGSSEPLPLEFALTDAPAEEWQPWHSVLVFKVRHAIMGKWEGKLTKTALLHRLGPERYALLDHREPIGSALILPPGARVQRLMEESVGELRAVAASVPGLPDDEGGSNSWAVHGSRTESGAPIVCNDSHRPLDVPNVYWQVRVSCPDFTVAGAAFPGLPAFPHFAHTGRLTWNITHGMADYQDLYLEEFAPGDPSQYRTVDGWAPTTTRREMIGVRGADAEPIDLHATHHGPIIMGNPRAGLGIAMRYTATDRPCRQWDTLRPMLFARSVEELHKSQHGWVEPVNNLVSADAAGNIGYFFRGRVPIRTSAAGRQFVVPGWVEHDWQGDVPTEQLPQSINPPEGFIATANQRPISDDEPYLAHEFAPPTRADRLAEMLGGGRTLSTQAVVGLQADVLSRPARAWGTFLARLSELEGDAGAARSMLAGFDGVLRGDRPEALLYATFRTSVGRHYLEPLLGKETWQWAASPDNVGAVGLIGSWVTSAAATLSDEDPRTPDGRSWLALAPPILAEAWQRAVAIAGSDPALWRWDDFHAAAPTHPLALARPELSETLNPPPIPMGGDGDTVGVAGYGYLARDGFPVVNLSVYRQVVDFADPNHASWIIPTGASGRPGSAHYADQSALYASHERVPMRLTQDDVEANAAHTLTLLPT